jgi:DNA-binding HxlR family transcriptional regulator
VHFVDLERVNYFNATRNNPVEQPSVHQMVESIIGCKWSLTVLDLVRKGVCRPGEMEHAIDGLSGKVLNERLTKLVRYGILEKVSFVEVPPHVEYRMTEFGNSFTKVLDEVDRLQQALSEAAIKD